MKAYKKSKRYVYNIYLCKFNIYSFWTNLNLELRLKIENLKIIIPYWPGLSENIKPIVFYKYIYKPFSKHNYFYHLQKNTLYTQSLISFESREILLVFYTSINNKKLSFFVYKVNTSVCNTTPL